MKLLNGNTEIEVTINVPTRTARKELNKLDKKQGEEFQKLNTDYKDVVAYYQMDEIKRTAAILANPELSKRTFDYKDAVEDITDKFNIEKFQVIIRQDKLKDADRELVLSKPEHEFWDAQDTKAVREAVESFRTGYTA